MTIESFHNLPNINLSYKLNKKQTNIDNNNLPLILESKNPKVLNYNQVNIQSCESNLDEYTICVKSFTDPKIIYKCNTYYMTCTCPDFKYRKRVCKHLKSLNIPFCY